MEYKIVKKFRKTALVDERGKTIVAAPKIRQLDSRYGQPVYVITDKDGLISVFDAKNNDYILTGASAAQGSPIINGVPMIFRKGEKNLYVSPKNAKVFDIPATDTLCIALSNDDQPCHDTVFQVHDGKPYPLHSPKVNPSKPTPVIRYPQGDTIENIYHPLLINGFSNVSYYLQNSKPEDYRLLAKSYAAVEGEEKLPEYLRSVITHLKSEVSQGGIYTLDKIGELIAIADNDELDLEKQKNILSTEMYEKQIQIDQINEELRTLGFPVHLEGRIRYMSKADKKSASKTLNEALNNPPEEIATLLSERESLNRDIFNIQFNKIQPIEESIYGGPSSIEDYRYGLQQRATSYTQIDTLEGAFETILAEYGMALPDSQDQEEYQERQKPCDKTLPTSYTEQGKEPTPPAQ